MDFRIADTFTDSLARLTGEEQKSVKTTAFDLQLNPAHPSMSFHKLDKAKDKSFWSVRVGSDIRLIVHKTAASLLLCYVDHHDKAYRWAERRKLETHPKTGAAQWVEIRERVEEVAPARVLVLAEPAARAWKADTPKPALFASRPDDELLGYGVPPEWLADVRTADEDGLLALADHLPGEAAEALLELATGGTPIVPPVAPAGADPFSHPDAQRRFRVMKDVEELERAFSFPWEKWTIFLHPAQRQWVERDYSGPARVSGSAGTGKTIVALHRAVFLARSHPESRVLLTTFSDTLANALRTKLRRLISNEPRLAERLEAHALNAVAERLYEVQHGRPRIVGRIELRELFAEVTAPIKDLKFNQTFLLGEWDELVDAVQLDTWEAYRDVKRLGRKTRLSEAQRAALWVVFAAVRERLAVQGLLTHPALFTQLAAELVARKAPPFDYVVVDEAQDVSVAQFGSWPHWPAGARMACSSRATWASAFSSRRFHGSHSAWTSAGDREPCTSTTAPRTRSACTPTGCSDRRSRTSMATPKIGAAPCRCSMGRRRRSNASRIGRLRLQRRRSGCVIELLRACRPMRSASSCDPMLRWSVRGRPPMRHRCLTAYSTRRSKPWQGGRRFARCILRRGSNFELS